MPAPSRQIILALARHHWIQTRWRLLSPFFWSFLFMAMNFSGRHNIPASPARPPGMILLVWFIVSQFTMVLAGNGVRSQSSIGFPEGLAESTRFTLALPVSRSQLLAVRGVFGWLEALAAAAILLPLTRALFPAVAAYAPPADFASFCLTTVIWMALPYSVALFFVTIMPEPLSFVIGGYALMLLLWLLHAVSPAVDVFIYCFGTSPLVTHCIPWPQLATSVILSAIFFLGAIHLVRTREY
jgi:hypothetical protein